MTNIVELLHQFAMDPNQGYARWHDQMFDEAGKQAAAKEHLERFFNARMDEVRLWQASQYGHEVLGLTDLEDFDHFRRGVLRREVSGEVSYPKQRDHSAHTLYNYLLGWYFYSKSDLVREEMHRAFGRRQFQQVDFDKVFADVWAFTSLLHDIGYLFEGGLEALSSETQSNQIRIGGEVSQEYFSHQFWTHLGLSAVDDREALRKQSGVEIPELERRTMTGLAYSLRSLGQLEPLRKSICTFAKCAKSPIKSPIDQQEGLASDAFELWKKNYEYFTDPNNPGNAQQMVKRIEHLETVFLALMQEGIPGSGVRVLDHGVCSGLLLLLAATFYFRVAYGMDLDTRLSNPRQDKVRETIKANCDRFEYSASWWWQATIWASGATAIHNVAQMKKTVKGVKTSFEKLSIEEDPLAYLGIMVDILQEWDRFTVARLSPLIGDGPLQGIDVTADPGTGGVLTLTYASDKDLAGEVRGALGRALKDWDKLVEIKP